MFYILFSFVVRRNRLFFSYILIIRRSTAAASSACFVCVLSLSHSLSVYPLGTLSPFLCICVLYFAFANQTNVQSHYSLYPAPLFSLRSHTRTTHTDDLILCWFLSLSLVLRRASRHLLFIFSSHLQLFVVRFCFWLALSNSAVSLSLSVFYCSSLCMYVCM